MTTKESNPKDGIGSRKSPISTLPIRVLWRVGLAMLEGAVKYGKFNYRAVGVRASVYFDAAVGRHLFSWWEGQDIDSDSGMHHIDKAIAGLMVLRDSMLQGNWVDDRPPCKDFDMNELNEKAGELIDLHADKNPKHYTISDETKAALGTPSIMVPRGLNREETRQFIINHANSINLEGESTEVFDSDAQRQQP